MLAQYSSRGQYMYGTDGLSKINPNGKKHIKYKTELHLDVKISTYQ